jgi:hypothetical protein
METQTPPQTAATQALLHDLANEKGLVKKLIADYRAGGIKSLSSDVPQLIEEGSKLYPEIRAAVTEIKAGAKTTEFWLTIGATGLITGASLSGHPLPVAEDAIVAGLVGVYALARATVKSFGTPATPTPVQGPPAQAPA